MTERIASRAAAPLLLLFLVVSVAPYLNRPFFGLHGYGEAQAAWLARSHATYGFSYTRGFPTYAVGHPPPSEGQRYLDHPALPFALDGVAMKVLGAHDRTLRLVGLAAYAAALLILLSLSRRMFSEPVAVIAALLFAAFPITQTFYSVWDYWQVPVTLAAWWFYFAHAAELNGIEPRRWHAWGLMASLFLMPQLGWPSAFFAAAIGTHYVGSRVRRRAPVHWKFAALLAGVPLLGFGAALAFLVAGNNWDPGELLSQFGVRSRAVTSEARSIWAWLGRQLTHVRDNYTAPVAMLAGAQVLAAPVLAWRNVGAIASPRFRFGWVFLGPGLLCMAVFTEVFWVHQTWYWPFSAGVALACAISLVQLGGLVERRRRHAGNVVTAGAVAALLALCFAGREAYAGRHNRSPEMLALLADLNRRIDPGDALLSHGSYAVIESPTKRPFTRPEVAWYLDRRIDVSSSVAEIQGLAAARTHDYYLVDVPPARREFVDSLRRLYVSQYFPMWEMDQRRPELLAWPESYLFYLRSPRAVRRGARP